MRQDVADLDCYDGQRWKRLEPQLVDKGAGVMSCTVSRSLGFASR